MRYLLDTNTCIAAMRQNASVIKRFSALSPSDCAISTITSYELFTGVGSGKLEPAVGVMVEADRRANDRAAIRAIGQRRRIGQRPIERGERRR